MAGQGWPRSFPGTQAGQLPGEMPEERGKCRINRRNPQHHLCPGLYKSCIDESVVVAGNLLKQLGGTLQREMQAGGPTAAVRVCREIAPPIANDISRGKGWKVTSGAVSIKQPLND